MDLTEFLVRCAHIESLVGLDYAVKDMTDDELTWYGGVVGWDGSLQTQIVRWS